MKKGAAKRRDGEEDDWAPVPATSSLSTLEKAARTCTACPLYKRATQTVFGQGPKGATFMLLGEQPGDREDMAGQPFVGPAGKLLDRALEEAGDQARRGLRHEHGEALQMEAARETSHSSKAKFTRNRRLPAVARSRAAPR